MSHLALIKDSGQSSSAAGKLAPEPRPAAPDVGKTEPRHCQTRSLKQKKFKLILSSVRGHIADCNICACTKGRRGCPVKRRGLSESGTSECLWMFCAPCSGWLSHPGAVTAITCVSLSLRPHDQTRDPKVATWCFPGGRDPPRLRHHLGAPESPRELHEDKEEREAEPGQPQRWVHVGCLSRCMSLEPHRIIPESQNSGM